MKKQSLVNKTTTFCTSLLAAICLNGSTPVFSQESTELHADITYTGSNQESVTFAINFVNREKENMLFQVLDNENRLLFSKNLKPATGIQNVVLYKTGDYDWGTNDKVTFLFKSGKNKYKKTFGITSTTTSVKEVTVAKL